MKNDLIFKIDDFEGPLDLLLEMFKKHKLEITKINLDPILDQYLEFINTLQNENYNIAVEYLEIASEIVLYKSKEIVNDETQEEEQEDDGTLDKEDLINKLLEYKKYKEASKDIKELEEQRNLFLTKEVVDLSSFKENKLEEISIDEFKKIINDTFLKIKLKKKKDETRVIEKNDLSIDDYIKELLLLDEIKFNEIIKDKDLTEVIIIFLSILEILKLKTHILLKSEEEIIILKVEENE